MNIMAGKSKKKYYVVWRGRVPGVYDDWSDAEEQILSFPGAKYKSFSSPQEAAEAFRQGMDKDDASLGSFLMGLRQRAAEKAPDRSYRNIPEVEQDAWAVDASCQKNPGIMEYQGVDLATGQRIFRIGPFNPATNNLGEFLAIVHALALMEKQGVRHTIYSDSRTAIGWVMKGQIRTTLKRTAANEQLFQLLERAIIWLRTHSFRTRIVKWDTENWGEIPADFGRK